MLIPWRGPGQHGTAVLFPTSSSTEVSTLEGPKGLHSTILGLLCEEAWLESVPAWVVTSVSSNDDVENRKVGIESGTHLQAKSLLTKFSGCLLHEDSSFWCTRDLHH